MNTGSPRAIAILASGAAGFVQSACLACALLSTSACARSVISVLPAQAMAQEAVPQPVSVRVDATTVRLPLVVSGAEVAFSDVDRALSRSVRKAIAAPMSKLTLAPGAHLDLQVEIVEAHAEYSHERLVVGLAARATLRREKGNAYVAQTHAHATASEHGPAAHGATAVLVCTDSIATDLARWLLGLDLR
jgi:hypothetical protein